MQPVAACGHCLGRLARERVPKMLSLGMRLGGKTDLSRMDGGKMGGWHASRGGGAGSWGPLWGWPGPAGVPGVAEPPSCVSGVGIPRWFSWRPGRVPVFSGPRTAPAVRACRPLPAAAGLPPRPARETASVPLSGTEPASPHVGVVPGPPSAGGVPGQSSALGALRKGAGRGAWHSRIARVRAMGDAGTRRESVLPGRLWLWVCKWRWARAP